ncbi:MAG: hypothetical protein IBX41_09065 [Methanophagales archaeon]|nr:hypothetical protein [Methanophagales archaeon]
MNNQKGQWIILSGLILTLGLVSLVILLNQAMSAGYKVSVAETDFASREITEIYEETVRTAKLVHGKSLEFNGSMADYATNISRIYAARGVILEITVTKHAAFPNIANVTMHYYDGKVNFSLHERMIQL